MITCRSQSGRLAREGSVSRDHNHTERRMTYCPISRPLTRRSLFGVCFVLVAAGTQAQMSARSLDTHLEVVRRILELPERDIDLAKAS